MYSIDSIDYGNEDEDNFFTGDDEIFDDEYDSSDLSNTGNNNADVQDNDDQIQPTSYDYASYDTDKNSDNIEDSDYDEFDSILYDDNNYNSDDNNYNSYDTPNIGPDNPNIGNQDDPIQPTSYDYASYDTSDMGNDNVIDHASHDGHEVSDNNQNSEYDEFDSIPYDYNDYGTLVTSKPPDDNPNVNLNGFDSIPYDQDGSFDTIRNNMRPTYAIPERCEYENGITVKVCYKKLCRILFEI